jgi:uncharacterized membrane protein (UPF0182 family)
MPKLKKQNILIYSLILIGLPLVGRGVRLLSDSLWFGELGLSSVFQKLLAVKLGLGLAAAALVWALLTLTLWISRRVARKPFIVIEPGGISSPQPHPQLAELQPLLQIAATLFVLFVSFVTGSWAAGHWETLLLFLKPAAFGIQDPIFHRDIGFYVFTLPFYRALFNFTLIASLSSMALAAVSYLSSNRIYLTDRGVHVSDEAKIHLAALSGFFCVVLSVHFHLLTYDLLMGQRQLLPGAGYSDINAYLPALKALRFVALIAGILLAASPWISISTGKLAAATAAFLALSVLGAGAYSQAMQKFTVAPNEIAKETPYIREAIRSTRQAYGLTDIQEFEFDPQENLTPQILKKNELTIKNIRLWDRQTLLTTFSQLQEIRTYYDFLDADNDRYLINGEYRQVMLSVRELMPESLPSRIWINEHLTYTHGYGLCVGPVNRISPEGLPEFFIKDIPPASNIPLTVRRPEIYFGESRAGYAIVRSKAKEFDYPAGDENVYTTYEGKGGVSIGGFWRRLLFAAHFGELKILLSSDLGPESRILYHRSVRDRLSRAAPFLRFDSDPYIVVDDAGRLVWIVDAYTVSDRYPYSENIGGLNYIRNSVKATVDAYDGTVRFYIADAQDPLVQSYARNFPGLFLPLADMPADLRSHIRYPQTLMSIQARIYSTYHMTDPQVFYNKEDLWKIPVRSAGNRSEQMEPYYTVMKLAGVGTKEEFILMAPFTPARKENMIAWMAARCDGENYGKLLVYNFPKQKLVFGPQQIESRIDQNPVISQQLTLWDQGGSRVLRGSLLVIPVEQSLLYVQPLYLEASGGGLPELKRIIVSYGNAIAMEDTLETALSRIFSGGVGSRLPEPNTAAPVQDWRGLARQARDHFERAQRAARQGDWAGYGSAVQDTERALKDLERAR